MGFVSQQIARFPLVFVLTFGIYTEGVAQCPCTDCRCSDSLELVKLYNATSGANWIYKWVLSSPIVTWNGVTLTGDRVTKLNLQSKNLIGNIPNLYLPSLEELNLSNNKLSGTIPNFDAPNLYVMSLQSNRLSGRIPNFNFLNLQSLLLDGSEGI